jgi:hypothetical protein
MDAMGDIYEYNYREKDRYLLDKERLLWEFGIIITTDIRERLLELYPNDIAIENYTRRLIRDKLNK